MCLMLSIYIISLYIFIMSLIAFPSLWIMRYLTVLTFKITLSVLELTTLKIIE